MQNITNLCNVCFYAAKKQIGLVTYVVKSDCICDIRTNTIHIVYVQEEQAVLEKIVHQRKASLVPSAKLPLSGNKPQILISQASISEADEPINLFSNLRRVSTQSVPVSMTTISFSIVRNRSDYH